MQALERHLEHVRRQHAESRDPVVQQLQAMVAAFEGRDEAYKPLCGQLQQVSETMRSSAQQIQASNSRLETSVQEAMNRSVSLVVIVVVSLSPCCQSLADCWSVSVFIVLFML